MMKSFLLVSLIPAAIVACSESPPGPALAPADAIPRQASVPAGQATIGVSVGVLRTQLSLGAFRISKTPTTVGQYRRCVDAGVCAPPSAACAPGGGLLGATYSADEQADQVPLTCAKLAQADQYCRWVGGRLPHVAEWMAAARGTAVARFAWGDGPSPTCASSARITYFDDGNAACCERACDDIAGLSVGQHSPGDSPFGMSDVLMTRQELLGPDSASPYVACLPPSSGCVVRGQLPGAIDYVLPAPPDDADNPATTPPAAGFRCVWEGAAQ
jgi:hypothetical protein